MRKERLDEWCYFDTRCARSYALPAFPSNSSVIDPSRLAPANQADQGAQLRRAVMGRAKLSLFQLSPQALTVVLMFDMDVVLLTTHSPQDASSRETCGSCFRVKRRRSEWEKPHTYTSWSAGYVVRFVQAQLSDRILRKRIPIEIAATVRPAVQSARTKVSVRQLNESLQEAKIIMRRNLLSRHNV